VTLPASPEEVFKAWLDSKQHSEMTGSEAIVEPRINGEFTAWDGYITGRTIEKEPFRRIVQEWRTTDFPSGSPDSVVEIRFESREKGTRMVLIHTKIPEGQEEEYKEGWKEFYFKPMKTYFKATRTE
jgi:activator of HSP90 ATPase